MQTVDQILRFTVAEQIADRNGRIDTVHPNKEILCRRADIL